jgi:transposase
MKPVLFVRALTEPERTQLNHALRSADAFTLRRAQYLLASARGLKPQEIAQTYGGCQQTVRNVIRAFHVRGLDCLTPNSNRPKFVQPMLSDQDLERLRSLLHQSPRTFGKNNSLWTLQLLAQVAYEQGITQQQVSDETIRRALLRLGANWKRAKHWITSPDPAYALKKSGESA